MPGSRIASRLPWSLLGIAAFAVASAAVGIVFEPEHNAFALGDRFVKFGHIGRHHGKVERFEAGPAGAGLDFGDAEQRIEGGENAFGLNDRLVDGSHVLVGRCIAPAHPLQPGQEASQRCP